MGLKSFTLEVKTKQDYFNYYVAMETITDLLDVEPCLDLHGAIEYKSKYYVLGSVNCTFDTYHAVSNLLKNAYGIKGKMLRLEQWHTKCEEYGNKIMGAYYYKNEDDFYNDLKEIV